MRGRLIGYFQTLNTIQDIHILSYLISSILIFQIVTNGGTKHLDIYSIFGFSVALFTGVTLGMYELFIVAL